MTYKKIYFRSDYNIKYADASCISSSLNKCLLSYYHTPIIELSQLIESMQQFACVKSVRERHFSKIRFHCACRYSDNHRYDEYIMTRWTKTKASHHETRSRMPVGNRILPRIVRYSIKREWSASNLRTNYNALVAVHRRSTASTTRHKCQYICDRRYITMVVGERA